MCLHTQPLISSLVPWDKQAVIGLNGQISRSKNDILSEGESVLNFIENSPLGIGIDIFLMYN